MLANALAALAAAEKSLARARKDAEQAREYAAEIESEYAELRAEDEKIKRAHAKTVIEAIRGGGRPNAAAPDFGEIGKKVIHGAGKLESARMAVNGLNADVVEAERIVEAARAKVEAEITDVTLAEADELVIQLERAEEIAGTLSARLLPFETRKPQTPRLARALGKINIMHNSREYHEAQRANLGSVYEGASARCWRRTVVQLIQLGAAPGRALFFWENGQ